MKPPVPGMLTVVKLGPLTIPAVLPALLAMYGVGDRALGIRLDG